MPKKKTSSKQARKKKTHQHAKKPVRKKARRKKTLRGDAANVELVPVGLKGLGAGTGGQSGDIQGLSGIEESGPESVEELAEEGQDYEAELASGVENAPDPDEEEVGSSEESEQNLRRKSRAE